MSDAIRWDLADTGVLTLTFDLPEVKNAVATAGEQLLVQRLWDAERHPGVKVVVLTGAGSAFCTGADVRTLGAPDAGDPIARDYGKTPLWLAPEARVDRLKRLAHASMQLQAMGKPTIAKLRGPAAGLGFSL